MARKLRSPTRTITRKGGRDYQGEFHSPKGTVSPLVFDSMSSLYCAMFLEHRRDVVNISFESERSKYVDIDGTEVIAIHDYPVVLETGEVEFFEAKYSPESLSKKDQAKLEVLQRCMAREGKVLNVVFRTTLEDNGFIQTVLLLRRFGQLPYGERSKATAIERMRHFEAATLDTWLSRAREAQLATGLLLHLLYHQQLPLLYEPLLATELLPCRA